MSNDLDAMRALHCAMTMMKLETLGFPRLHHSNFAAHLPVVISGHNNRLAASSEVAQKSGGFGRRRFIVDEVAEDNQLARPIFIYQLQQAVGNRRHPPHRDEPARRALAEFVAKMEVGYRQPALRFMKKSEATIEHDALGNHCLVRT